MAEHPLDELGDFSRRLVTARKDLACAAVAKVNLAFASVPLEHRATASELPYPTPYDAETAVIKAKIERGRTQSGLTRYLTSEGLADVDLMSMTLGDSLSIRSLQMRAAETAGAGAALMAAGTSLILYKALSPFEPIVRKMRECVDSPERVPPFRFPTDPEAAAERARLLDRMRRSGVERAIGEVIGLTGTPTHDTGGLGLTLMERGSQELGSAIVFEHAAKWLGQLQDERLFLSCFDELEETWREILDQSSAGDLTPDVDSDIREVWGTGSLRDIFSPTRFGDSYYGQEVAVVAQRVLEAGHFPHSPARQHQLNSYGRTF